MGYSSYAKYINGGRLKMNLADFKPQGSLCICNNLCIEIMTDSSGSYVYYKYSDSDTVEEAEIIYEGNCTGLNCDAELEPYFYTEEGVKYDINDFVRTNL